MVGIFLGLALFFCVIWAMSVLQRRSEANEKAAFLAEQNRQHKKWVEDYKPSEGDMLPAAKPQAN
jgi:hypothetical protein